jgi:hypothetical protein
LISLTFELKTGIKSGENMPESLQIMVGICFLVLVYILTRWGTIIRARKAAMAITKDLQARHALDPATAVKLSYERPSTLRMGLRDFRPKALESLVMGKIVGKTDDSRYYLIATSKDLRDLTAESR